MFVSDVEKDSLIYYRGPVFSCLSSDNLALPLNNRLTEKMKLFLSVHKLINMEMPIVELCMAKYDIRSNDKELKMSEPKSNPVFYIIIIVLVTIIEYK